MSRRRVVVVRGHQVTPWELAPWGLLPGERWDVEVLQTASSDVDLDAMGLKAVPARTLGGRAPGRIGALAVAALGDRYLGIEDALRGADVVHAEELSYWFSADVSRLKARCGFRLVQTAWETIPFLDAYRSPPARRRRAAVLEHTDLFLAATARARDALLLEGVAEDRVVLCPPGIDVSRFAAEAAAPATEHVLLSPARLVHEKGHADVLRALALLRRGILKAPAVPRLVIVGRGAEEARLRAHADELGVGDLVEFRGQVPYAEMPGLFASASALVLMSLPLAAGGLHPLAPPRLFWEEQFGLVLAEAMAARLPIVTTRSGAIPEVVDGNAALVDPGDWRGLAQTLAEGVLSRTPGTRAAGDPELLRRYSTEAMAERLNAAYLRVLGATS